MNRRSFIGGILGATGAAALPEVQIPAAPPLPPKKVCARCDGGKLICERVPLSDSYRTFEMEKGVMPTLWTPRSTTRQVPCPECSA